VTIEYAHVLPRRGTAATWTSVNPVLLMGEEGLETDTGKTKRGDGATAWAALPYDAPNATVLSSTYARVFAVDATFGDGVTDATAHIQSRINACAAAGGGVVYVPVGHYMLTAVVPYSLTVPSEVTLSGAGDESHLEVAPGATLAANDIVHAVMIGTPSVAASNACVTGLRVTGNQSLYAGRYIQGIAARHDADPLQHSDVITIEGCWVDDVNIGIGSCKTGDAGGQTDPARLSAHFTGWTIRGNRIWNAQNKAIELQESDNSEILDNHCLNVSDGPQVLSYCNNVNIIGNHVTYAASGINVSEGSSRIFVAGNHVTALAGGSSGRGAMALRREPFTGDCVSEHITIIGNTFDGSAASSSPNALAFESRTGNGVTSWRSVRVINNTFKGIVQLYDITSQTASSASDLLFSGNVFVSLLNTPVTWASAGTLFRDNTFRVAHTINSDAYRYHGNRFEDAVYIAATSDSMTFKDNNCLLTLANLGTNINMGGNIVSGVYQPDTLTQIKAATVATSETTTLTSYTSLTTDGPIVTVVIGQSGSAIAYLGAWMGGTSVGSAQLMSITATAGPTALAASDANAARYIDVAAGAQASAAATVALTGLTPGTYTFSCRYKTSGGTGTWLNRSLTVIPL